MYAVKDLLQVRQYSTGELIYQERATRVKQRVGLAEDDLPNLGRDGGVWYSGDDVIGTAQIEASQRRIGFGR